MAAMLRLLETDEYEVAFEFSTGLQRVTHAEFNPSGTLLALTGAKEVQVWKMPGLSALPTKVTCHDGLRFIKGTNTLICLGDTITAWDWQTRACLAALPCDTESVSVRGGVAAISLSGKYLAVSNDGVLDLWNIESFLPLSRLNYDGTVVPLELRRGRFPKPRKRNPLTPAIITLQYPSSLAFSPDDKTLAIARGNGSLQTWQIAP
jgi:WD40 repeat protein